MDTITHGIAGALIGKAVFRGEDMLAARPMNRGRVVTWVLMLGAIFPDADIFRDMASSNKLLLLTWHRSITHSLVCMPLFALALAWLTRVVLRYLKWEAPSFWALTGLYAVGILSHIFLDLATTFGTMIWSPIDWSRPAWDILYIIDFTFSAILLCPQFAAWVYRKPENLKNRASITWSVFALGIVGVAAIAKNVGTPMSASVVVSAIAVLSAVFLLPAIRGKGLRIRYAAWNGAGLALAGLYILAAFFAHRAALERTRQFASFFQLQVQSLGALPLPPSIWRWDGLVETARGVYEVRFDMTEPAARSGATISKEAGGLGAIEHRYYPDAPPNPYIEEAMRLHDVQTVMWFARFPVIRFHKEGNDPVVEILDLRFAQMRRDRPAAFTYKVTMDESGKVISQGWERE